MDPYKGFDIPENLARWLDRLVDEINKTKSGNASISPDGSGEGTISHGLPSTPNYVNANLRGDSVNGVDVVSVDSSELTVRIKDASGADVTTGTHTVDWIAKI